MLNAADYGLKEHVITEILALAQKHKLDKLVLFGSRSKGSYSRSSDIDLAVYGGDPDGFATDAEETVNTLLFFDVIDMNQHLSPDFLQQIENGIVIYEKV